MSVPRRIELLPRAVRELEALPERLRDQIVAKIEALRELPEIGSPMFDAFSGYRSLLAVHRTYRVVYRIRSANLVEIAYIRHCRRRPAR